MRKLNAGLNKWTWSEHPERVLQKIGDRIDITRDPFSDLGSPLLVYKERGTDRLFMKVARRFTSFPQQRPCLEDLCLTDQNGTALDFKMRCHPHALLLETELGTFQMAFHTQDTLAIGLPKRVKCGITFQIHPPLCISSTQEKNPGNILQLETQTTVSPLEEEINRKEQGEEVRLTIQSGEDDAIHLQFQGGDGAQKTPPPFSQTLETSGDRWRTWFAQVPPGTGAYEDVYQYAWWVLGNNLIDPRGLIPYPGVMPSKAKYIGIWNWDACFHALALRHMDPELARDQLRIILAHQKQDGMLPDAVHQDGVVDWIDHPFPNTVTKPPLLAWAALKIHEVDPQNPFLEKIYPQVVAWHDWWFSRTDDHGLAQYHHPYASGLDDSPLWDYGFPVTSPDLNTYLVIQRESLAEICRILGKEKQAADWLARADDLTGRMIEHLYSTDLGYFPAQHGGKPIPVFTPLNLYPLWTGRLSSPIQNSLLDHLQDPSKFWSEHPLATVTMDSSSFDPHTMWRGPTWANINYLIIQALSRIGKRNLALRLREKTLDLVKKSHGIFEYYHPQSGIAPAGAAPIFSWTAAVCIDLILETHDGQPGNHAPASSQ